MQNYILTVVSGFLAMGEGSMAVHTDLKIEARFEHEEYPP